MRKQIYQIWNHEDQALVLLPLPGQELGDVDTSGSDWMLMRSFEADNPVDAVLRFEEFCRTSQVGYQFDLSLILREAV